MIINSTMNLWKLGKSSQFSEVTQNEDNLMLRVLALVCIKCNEFGSLDIEERGDSEAALALIVLCCCVIVTCHI